MDFGFDNLFDLYKRLIPCLNFKVNELRKYNIYIVKKEDIWNYLLKEKWKNTKGLTLDMMVDDILNTDNSKLEKYTKDLLLEIQREAEFDDAEIIL